MAISSSSSSSSSDNKDYELALESLESRILRHEKNEMAWGLSDEEEVFGVKKVRLENQTVKTRDDKRVLTRTEFVSTVRPSVSTARPVCTGRPSISTARHVSTASPSINTARPGYTSRPIYPRMNNDHVVVDSGCSSHMTGNKACLSEYEDYNGGFVAFGSDPKGDELNFKILNESQVVLRAPRKDDVYSLDLKNVVPFRGKFERKSDEGYLLGYSTTSKAFRNTRILMFAQGSSRKDKGPTQEYILLPLHPHRTRIPVKDVVQDAQEKPSENSSPDKDVHDTEDAADKEEQHQMKESEQDLQDELEKMVTQELAAKQWIDCFQDKPLKKKIGELHLKRRQQATSTNKLSTDRQSVSTDRPSISTDSPFVSTNRPYVSAASTSTGANADESSFVYLGGKIPIDASTFPNADLPIDQNMPDLEDAYDTLPNDRIFNGDYDDDKNVGVVADFNNIDNTIAGLEIYICSSNKREDSKASSAQQALFEEECNKRFQMSSMVKSHSFWDYRTATTPIESNKPLVKDEDGEDVDVHVYRSMIGSLMYLTASRPDIMFAVCACARFQVTPKASHLNAVKRIFRYLKHQPKLGLWYPRDSPFELEAFSDSDYGGASLDRKSTTGGCQFLGRRLISWQCKKQTIVANSTTEAEYVAAANCCGQVLWIQNQMMDYGFNFMNTRIHIDNESTISVIKNPVAHSRTKHIEIRFHFIRDCYEKRLIEVIKIHTDSNVADLLTKGFDVTRFNFLVVSIGMLNL
ncbi:hypothetical protein Tco_0564271 [Tanacetum coccineum]